MRIDLQRGGRRPWIASMLIRLVSAVLGSPPGPQLFLSYRPDLQTIPFVLYLARGAAAGGPWSQGEMELFGTFTSDLNACHF